MKFNIPINVRPVKKSHKIQVDCSMLEFIIPGASELEFLPRKKKKALKKKIAKGILNYIDEHAEELIELMKKNKIENV